MGTDTAQLRCASAGPKAFSAKNHPRIPMSSPLLAATPGMSRATIPPTPHIYNGLAPHSNYPPPQRHQRPVQEFIETDAAVHSGTDRVSTPRRVRHRSGRRRKDLERPRERPASLSRWPGRAPGHPHACPRSRTAPSTWARRTSTAVLRQRVSDGCGCPRRCALVHLDFPASLLICLL